MKTSNLPKTEKGQQTREQIVATALRLFLKHGYEKATIAEIIAQSGMSRGSIFYYYPDKFTLYKEVVDRYVLSAHRLSSQVRYREEQTLWEFIHEYAEGIRRLIAGLSEIPEYSPITYFNMTYQAALYYPGLKEKIAEIFKEEDEVWEKIIRADIRRGNVSGKLDVGKAIQHFRHAYLGLSVETSFSGMIDPDRLLELYEDIYRRVASE